MINKAMGPPSAMMAPYFFDFRVCLSLVLSHWFGFFFKPGFCPRKWRVKSWYKLATPFLAIRKNFDFGAFFCLRIFSRQRIAESKLRQRKAPSKRTAEMRFFQLNFFTFNLLENERRSLRWLPFLNSDLNIHYSCVPEIRLSTQASSSLVSLSTQASGWFSRVQKPPRGHCGSCASSSWVRIAPSVGLIISNSIAILSRDIGGGHWEVFSASPTLFFKSGILLVLAITSSFGIDGFIFYHSLSPLLPAHHPASFLRLRSSALRPLFSVELGTSLAQSFAQPQTIPRSPS